MADGFKRAGSVLAVIAFAGAFLVPGLGTSYGISLPWAWLISAALLATFCTGVGLAISGRPAGVIIDNRNRISLSKLQAVAWSIIVLSAWLTCAFARVSQGFKSPIDVDLTPDLLAVMGISATSLVAAPTILSLKSNETPPAGQAAATATKLGEPASNVVPAGKVYARTKASDAKWLDMVRGEEVSNAASPDLSKIQQLLITVVTLVVYSASLWAMFGSAYSPAMKETWLATLPAFDAHMVWLIGISHAGYLAYKAAPHGSSAPTAPPAAANAGAGVQA
jgi:hypothetical protein